MKNQLPCLSGILAAIVLSAMALPLDAQVVYPESGWWWNPGASGRGYFIERQDDVMFVGAFVYADDGAPEWLTAVGEYEPSGNDPDSIGLYTGDVYRSENGQCIGCPDSTPESAIFGDGRLTIDFSDNRNGVLEWYGESISITRYSWSWSSAVDQLNGTWLFTQLEQNESFSQLVTIENSGTDSAASINNRFSGAEVGTVEILADELVLTLVDASESVLPILLPETGRFYAGYGDSAALQVIAVRLDDMPLGALPDPDHPGDVATDGTTNGVFCDYSDTTPNAQASLTITSLSEWTCSETARLLTANGIPDHAVGAFPNPGNPNTISEQTVSASYTLAPVLTGTVTSLGGPAGVTGYILNGVKIDANTAGTCNNSGNNCSLAGNVGNWSIEALGQSSFNFGDDENHAHVQPNGAYHYHGIPEGFVAKRGGSSSSMTLIGWAADGFPIYARYGYSVADDASSEIRVITGSYQLVSNVSGSRPSVSTYPLGTFSQDWEYVEGSGDLDECNGRFGVTPEFPEGIYHYYATDSYPYLQRCVKGEL